jgi:hypothetical protein
MLLGLLLITLFNTLDTTSTKFDYTNINQNIYQPINKTINQNITNKTIIIYENYSMLDVFSHHDSKPISKQDLITFVSLLPKFSHYPINIRYLLDQYDAYMYQMETFYNSIVSILYDDSNPKSETIMLQFIDDTNKKLYEISNKCKTFCLNVVAKANQKGVFNNFSAFRLNKSKFPSNVGEKKTNKNTQYSKSDIFVSASASFLTGDFITPIYIVSDYLFSQPIPPHNSSPNDHNADFTPNADLWLAYSKIYCINTFSMRIDYHNDIIYIIGDKIPYEFTANFISIIQQNINQHLAMYSKDSINFRVLENMLQQFEVIKLLVYKIEEFIVFDIYDKLTNIIQTSFLNPLDVFKFYIDDRIIDLYKMNELTNIDFPISQMEIKEQQQLNHVINQINEHIKREIANQNKQKQTNSMFNAEQKVSMNKVLNDVKNMEFEAWASLYIYNPLKRTGLLVSKAFLALPEGIAVGGLQGIYGFINNVVSIFIFNPFTTSIIIFIGLSVVYVTVANSIIMIINFFKWIYWCVSFPFVSLYRFLVWLNSFDIDSYF